MALLKIARMGHPVLRSPAAPVSDPTSPEIRRLVADMVETMADAGGVGLAAPQVHVPKRVLVFHVPHARQAPARYREAGLSEEEQEVGLTVLINPEVEPLGEEMREAWEGCLSLPGFVGLVPRYERVRYTGMNLNGETVERIADGFHARVVQHELDHLDGRLYPMRVRDLTNFGFLEEIRRGLEADAAVEAEEARDEPA